ncbi:MAG: NAD kinase [Bacteroidales bacterium]|nr:NAD kinase [Bacteroidales bacterium]
MKIAVFGRNFNAEFTQAIHAFFDCLNRNSVSVVIHRSFYTFIESRQIKIKGSVEYFSEREDFPDDVDFLVSIGGDGTFLESLMYLKRFDIPVIGLNSGRLGFLANISKEEISEALDQILAGNYKLDRRSLLVMESGSEIFGRFNFALNDATIQKKDTNLITIETFLNDEYLNAYWTDGLIISTATGSTAYNLAVGGPIVLPGSTSFVIAPIASHNLTVRPLVIPDDMEIRLEVKSRSGNFLVSVDNRTELMDIRHNVFKIRKAAFQLNMVKLPFNNYYSTLRNKLMWGADLRN